MLRIELKDDEVTAGLGRLAAALELMRGSI